jgi:cob(I)alamin adenosyltransferase
VQEPWIDELEGDCDRFGEPLETLRSFILPGGTPGSAYLHVARTVTRRAERSAWAAVEAHGTGEHGGVSVLPAKYLNRLSDLLFILGRYANHGRGGDVLWVPGGGRDEAKGMGPGTGAGEGSEPSAQPDDGA